MRKGRGGRRAAMVPEPGLPASPPLRPPPPSSPLPALPEPQPAFSRSPAIHPKVIRYSDPALVLVLSTSMHCYSFQIWPPLASNTWASPTCNYVDACAEAVSTFMSCIDFLSEFSSALKVTASSTISKLQKVPATREPKYDRHFESTGVSQGSPLLQLQARAASSAASAGDAKQQLPLSLLLPAFPANACRKSLPQPWHCICQAWRFSMLIPAA